jgi:FkbM family methyltransferase
MWQNPCSDLSKNKDGGWVKKLKTAIELLSLPGALTGLLTWKKFSLAAFKIVMRLKHAGVDPATVIDVGANVGQFSVAVSKGFPNAALFPVEPDPATAKILQGNVAPSVANNITVTAIGERVGTIEFQVNTDSQVSSVLSLGEDRKQSFPGSSVQRTMSVPLTTLDALFGGRGLTSPVLLKIDVQGYEDQVIAGAAAFLQSVRWVVMEVSFARLYEGEKDFPSMLALMTGHGFRFVRPLNFHTLGQSGAIIEMDALFEKVQYTSED